MNFRQAKGTRLAWTDSDHPFSNFLFIDKHYRSNPVLRRIFSLARKLKYKSLLIDEIAENDCDLLQAENRAIALRRPDFKKSVVHRLSFFNSPKTIEPKAENFLGYAVFKSDEFATEITDHVYEAVLPPFRRAKENNFIPSARDYEILTTVGMFKVNGVLYAQQNDLTYVCAHVGLRTALSTLVPDGDVSYEAINAIAGIDHINSKVGRGAGANGKSEGLKLSQIETVLKKFGLHVPPLLINEPAMGHPYPDEYQKHLYGYIESGYPALLCFELGGAAPNAQAVQHDRHLIPVIGHTFNEDAWMPDAQRIYFGNNFGYFPSEHYLSSYMIHDDNLGPYLCIPRHYLKQENFRAIFGIQCAATPLMPIQAETFGSLYLNWISKNLSSVGKDWYDRFTVFAQCGLLVLRTTLIQKPDYLKHLGTIRSREGKSFEPDLIAKFDSRLPDVMWMVEVSAPELFSCSRRKFGEVILSASMPLPPQIDLSLFLSARLPGIVLMNEGGQFPVGTTTLEGHSELYTRSA